MKGSLTDLLQIGYDVCGLVRPCASRDLKMIEPFLDEMTLLTGDVTSLNSVSNILRSTNPDLVFHLATLSPVEVLV